MINLLKFICAAFLLMGSGVENKFEKLPNGFDGCVWGNSEAECKQILNNAKIRFRVNKFVRKDNRIIEIVDSGPIPKISLYFRSGKLHSVTNVSGIFSLEYLEKKYGKASQKVGDENSGAYYWIDETNFMSLQIVNGRGATMMYMSVDPTEWEKIKKKWKIQAE